MGLFGGRLQREREKRGITLEEIAEATKIGTRSLRALEQEDFSKLPGGIFNKGFVRAYARHLGIDEEETVADYEAAVGEYQPPSEVHMAEVIAAQRAQQEAREGDVSRPPWFGMIVVLVTAVLTIAGWTVYAKYRAGRSGPQPAATEPAPAATPTRLAERSAPSQGTAAPVSDVNAAPPQASSGNAPSAAAAPAVAEPKAVPSATKSPPPGRAAKQANFFEVHIRAVQAAWVKIVADGKEVVSENLEPSTEKSVRASQSLIVTTGNAGGVEISFNGTPVSMAGGEGKVATVTFNAQGVVQ